MSQDGVQMSEALPNSRGSASGSISDNERHTNMPEPIVNTLGAVKSSRPSPETSPTILYNTAGTAEPTMEASTAEAPEGSSRSSSDAMPAESTVSSEPSLSVPTLQSSSSMSSSETSLPLSASKSAEATQNSNAAGKLVPPFLLIALALFI